MVIGVDCSRAFQEERTGTENYSYYLLRAMLKLEEAREHKWVLFVRGGKREEVEEFLADLGVNLQVEVVEIGLRFLWTQAGLAFESWRRGLDTMFVPAHTLPVLRRPGVRTVVTVHGLEYEWLPEYESFLQRWYLPLSTIYAVRSATKVIAVSEYTKSQLVGRLGVEREKIEVIWEGVEEEFFGQKRPESRKRRVFEKYGIKGRFLLFVGSIQPRKNLQHLIYVYNELQKEQKDLQLVIAGGKGWQWEGVFELPEKLGIKDKVVFTGRVSDEELAVLLQGAAVYVQPSYTEGFGLPVLEAMASGTSVVSSSGGALPEVVGDAGLVLAGGVEEGFEVEGWVRELKKLLGEEKWREELVGRGKERVKNFKWSKSAKKSLKRCIL